MPVTMVGSLGKAFLPANTYCEVPVSTLSESRAGSAYCLQVTCCMQACVLDTEPIVRSVLCEPSSGIVSHYDRSCQPSQRLQLREAYFAAKGLIGVCLIRAGLQRPRLPLLSQSIPASDKDSVDAEKPDQRLFLI